MITVNQASIELGITPSLVRRFCRSGQLKSTKIGRDWIIDIKSLNSFKSHPRKIGRPCKN